MKYILTILVFLTIGCSNEGRVGKIYMVFIDAKAAKLINALSTQCGMEIDFTGDQVELDEEVRFDFSAYQTSTNQTLEGIMRLYCAKWELIKNDGRRIGVYDIEYLDNRIVVKLGITYTHKYMDTFNNRKWEAVYRREGRTTVLIGLSADGEFVKLTRGVGILVESGRWEKLDGDIWILFNRNNIESKIKFESTSENGVMVLNDYPLGTIYRDVTNKYNHE